MNKVQAVVEAFDATNITGNGRCWQ